MEKEIENTEKDLIRLDNICQGYLKTHKPIDHPIIREQCGIIEDRLLRRIYTLNSNIIKNKLREALEERSQN